MHDIASIAGMLAGLISLSGFFPYILSTLRKETKPNRASWMIWAIVSTIIALSYREVGASYAFLAPVGYAVGSSTVFILSIKNGVGGWTPFDRRCLIGAAISLLLWQIFNSPMSALLINLFINFLATLPTLRKAWHQPESENKIGWTLFSLSTVVNLFAIEEWTFSLAVYPVTIVFLVGIVTVLLLWTKRLQVFDIRSKLEKCPFCTEMKGEGEIVCRTSFRTFEGPGKNDEHTSRLNAHEWVKKGFFLYKSGDFQKAIQAFSIAVDIDVAFPLAYLNRAVAYKKVGAQKQAIQNLEIAAMLGHKNARLALRKLKK